MLATATSLVKSLASSSVHSPFLGDIKSSTTLILANGDFSSPAALSLLLYVLLALPYDIYKRGSTQFYQYVPVLLELGLVFTETPGTELSLNFVGYAATPRVHALAAQGATFTPLFVVRGLFVLRVFCQR
ncbi:hypothetical protein AGABI2DRAFT_117231 [Agaricus bisporus var. bisporus H97]|uniref:hypothetical protein n=1 Tax=Agaricus bisporus var. bisporus (strain H97 / ATCC MYA-4626 / FGSC 10389) TaxID=936046 RepID=UPI00029F7D74|nr:hypothetical protein AGABI2DRAFT_117231 [Agaricus bisporus var. bisporus H97]EKV48409.1 hypothetical protein AGABI2DRAFT_117231 [Agaricus bisporus var. bisporus H97]